MKLSKFFLLLSPLFALSFAQFQPHHEPIIAGASEYPPRPNVLLILDDSATMGEKDMAGNISRISVLQDVTRNLVTQYANSAYIGLSGLGYSSPHTENIWRHGARKPLKMVVSDISGNSAEKNQAINLTNTLPSDGNTPLAFALYEATKYYRGLKVFMGKDQNDAVFNEAHHPVRYRCQQNHVIMLSDIGGSNEEVLHGLVAEDVNGGAVSLNAQSKIDSIAEKMWKDIDLRDYPPKTSQLAHLSAKDMAGKPWKEAGDATSRKMPIYFHGIFFGAKGAQGPALDVMKKAASYSNGLVAVAHDTESLGSKFSEIFKNIVTTRSGTGAFEDQVIQTKDTLRYSSIYDPTLWSGEIQVVKYDPSKKSFPKKVDSTTNVKWSTDDTIKANQGRFITLGNQEIAANKKINPDYITWLKGTSVEGLRVRAKPLGDIINSHLFYSAKDHLYINTETLSSEVEKKFIKYLLDKDESFKPNLIIAGSNDGLLNFIVADKNNTGIAGQRHTTYFPNFFIEDLADITAVDYTHSYKVDGSTHLFDALVGTSESTAHFKTMGITMMGAGKRGFVGYEIATDGQLDVQINFEITNKGKYQDLGYTYSEVEFFNQKTTKGEIRAVAAIGNGFGASKEEGTGITPITRSVVYLMDMGKPEEPLQTILLDAKGYGAAAPALVIGKDPLSGFQQLEALYVGDYSGKFYKVTFNTHDPVKRDALEVMEIKSLFDANSDDNPYKNTAKLENSFPITVKPALVRHPEGKTIWAYFGTGMAADKQAHRGENSKVIQAFYGIRDSGEMTKFSQLTKQSLDGNKQITKDASTDLDDRADLYSTKTSSNSMETGKNRGWFLPLDDQTSPFSRGITGERVILPASVFSDTAINLTTWGIIEGEEGLDPCLGDIIFGRTLFLDLFSGASLDLDGEGQAGMLLINDAPGIGTAPSLQAGNTLSGNRSSGTQIDQSVVEQLRQKNGINDKDTSYPAPKQGPGSGSGSDLGSETVSFGTYNGGIISLKLPVNIQEQIKKRIYWNRKI